jgi:hypothetical protein
MRLHLSRRGSCAHEALWILALQPRRDGHGLRKAQGTRVHVSRHS